MDADSSAELYPIFIKKYSNYNIINLDLLTYAGDKNNSMNVIQINMFVNVIFVIENYYLISLRNLIWKVLFISRESHVDNSISNPDIFVKTNVNGTFNLLETHSNSGWKPNLYKDNFKESRFHHISTDEVYGSLGDIGLFKEQTPMLPILLILYQSSK